MRARLATPTALAAALLGAMALGGSLYEAMVVYPAWSAAPPATLALLQGQSAVDSAGFWIVVHVGFEVALAAALALNWRARQRRQLLLAALGVHLGVRLWTFAYFVPEIPAFAATLPGGAWSPELAARVDRWGELGWLLRALIAATSLLVLLAPLAPALPDGPSVRRGAEYGGDAAPAARMRPGDPRRPAGSA